jgi:outer membrane protein TolC
MIKFLIIVIIIGSRISLSFAQRTLTLSECITLAYKNNLQLHNSRAAFQTGIYTKREQIAAGHPQINAASTVTYAPHSNHWGYDPISTDGGLVNALISIQQHLSSPRVNRLQAQLSDIDQHILKLQMLKTERDLTISIKQQFVEVLRGEEESRLRKESITRLSEYLSMVQLQYTGGTGAYGDVIRIKTQISTEQETLFKTQMAVSISKLSLALLMGDKLDASFELNGNIDTMLSKTSNTKFVIDTIENPDIAAAQSEITRGNLELGLLKRAKFPSFSINIDGGYLSSFDRLMTSDSKTTFGFSAGTNIGISLVDWSVLHNQKLKQQLIIDTLQTAAKIQVNALQNEFLTLQIKISGAWSLLKSIQDRINYAEEDYLLTKSRHTAGASSSAELLLAQQNFSDALLDELQTKADILFLTNNLEQLSYCQRSDYRDK